MLSYVVEVNAGDTRVIFVGPVDEDATQVLSKLHAELGEAKNVVFDLKGISSINSLGIRSWVNFIRGFGEGRTLVWENCSPDVISQINMISSFAGESVVRSFEAAYCCPNCDHVQHEHFEAADGLDSILEQNKEMVCKSCGGLTELEVDEESFFGFLDLTDN